MGLSRRSRVFLSFFLTLLTLGFAGAAATNYTGVNETGLNSVLVPQLPNITAISHLISKGVNVFRFPVYWESIQPTPNGTLSVTYLAQLDTAIRMVTTGVAIIDIHNNATWNSVTFGSTSAVDAGAYADLWRKIATKYSANQSVWFGLMNAPNMGTNSCSDSALWFPYAQQAVNAIRQVGATNKILIPSGQSSIAETWQDPCKNGDIMNQISDSASNFSFDVQQYFVSNGTMALGPCSKTTAVFDSMTLWLRSAGRTAFLSSFAVNWDDSTCVSMLPQYLKYFEDNMDVWLGWTYWAGGSLVPRNTGFYYVESTGNSTDSVLLTVLSSYLANRSPIANTGSPNANPPNLSSSTTFFVCAIVVGVSLLILLIVILIIRIRSKCTSALSMNENDAPDYKPAKKRPTTNRKTLMEEKELRDAVKQMMMNNNVPLKDRVDPKSNTLNMKRMRLDAASATETFQAKNINIKETESGQFSHFVNFTSSRFQVESQAPTSNDDSYLF
ncbi:hypothetical protein BASA50_007133 [Batrachochytrium salamandrivorans]|uniref:cellulase n=1 Tax=Batrachochytrium salamandrivorans TaxID=1357716 RepID=A0ABQ8F7W8_9FUNG|nr:hypothetical protein BASA62_002801 [Batrachochytrium salamandrivorans]KAH6588906.1 hypothetical protein BASA61_005786 [Batrachochytrium salamandrivorans]KAH6593757.1 hypothetical protein BASA50_007133 [Batrachochytrium salamandrivorans]KAH9245169.1 hypothetical protein BASA81_017366 [Batrachochytrium salamandrivorans]